jgi:hypothetical protein
VPDSLECDPSGPWFESIYANFGTTSPGCDKDNTSLCGGFWKKAGGADNGWVETYVHDGGAGAYQNIRFEDYVNHDQQANEAGTGSHPGCLMTFDTNSTSTAHNMVLDHYYCERAHGATLQMGDSGVTIQNSVFTCLVSALDQASGQWDSCASGVGSPAGMACKAPAGACTQSNLLIRYNVFLGTEGAVASLTFPDAANEGGTFGAHSNVRVYGNIFFGTPVCGRSGVTYDSNTFTSVSTPCGTNSTTLGSGDPLTQTSIQTPGDLYIDDGGYGTVLDIHADGSPTLPTLNPTALNTACGCTDYTLGWDGDRDARSSTSTKPGADG